MRSGSPDGAALLILSVITDILGCEILLFLLLLLSVLRSGEKPMKLVRGLNAYCSYSGSIDAISICFPRYEVKTNVKRCKYVSKASYAVRATYSFCVSVLLK